MVEKKLQEVEKLAREAKKLADKKAPARPAGEVGQLEGGQATDPSGRWEGARKQ